MFTLLSGIRLHSANRPYLGSISSNLNPHGLGRPPNRHGSGNGSGSVRTRTPFGSVGERCKVQVLEVVLDKDTEPVFEPGQEVTGKVVLVCSGTMGFRSLSVSMRGSARVRWTESTGGSALMGTSWEQFNAEIEYFNKKRFLVNSPPNGDRHVIPEGRHEFRFRFHLPTSDDIATSFEGRFGSVRYFIRADLDQSWAFTHRSKKSFTVISPVDINTDEQLTSVSREAEKTLCCWWCSRGGGVSFSASTDRKGYCPGESVAIDAQFVNHSPRRIHPEAVLCQTQTFTAGGKTRTKKSKVTILSGRTIPGCSNDTWDALLLKIPPLSPSIINCRLIKVEYTVRVSLVIPGATKLSVNLPIVIGTVPLRRSGLMQLRPQANMECSDGQMSSDPAPPYCRGDDPPPSYVECLEAETDLIEADDEEDNFSAESRFVPMYRYVTDYQYNPHPPEYSEVDPFPCPDRES